MKKLTIIFALFISYIANSQSLSIFDIDTTNFPIMKAKFWAFAQDGKQITNLTPSDFELKENGQLRKVTKVSCPVPKPPLALSSVLVFDVSGSMRGSNMNLAKEAATLWVNSLPLGKSECAVTSFENLNYLNQDFTTERTKLLNAINGLQTNGGTNYDAALINPLAGGLIITKNGKHKKVIVMLTDGQASEPQVSQIVAEANTQNTTLYFVTLNMPCPESLQNIAYQTDGQWFENVASVEQAKQIYQQILQTAQGGVPCEITWESGVTCVAGTTNIEMKIKSLNEIAEASYKSLNKAVVTLEFVPATVKFLNPTVGVKVEQKITITARNADFSIKNITSSNAGFDIKPKRFKLNSGKSFELTVSYFPVDSGYNYCRFEIENDYCTTKYYASGGWEGIKPKIKTIKLIHPNGGEVFVAGSDTVITWEGVTPDEPVKLEYRIDDNKSWMLIADSVIGLSYKWRVPKTASNKCLARVTSAANTLQKYEEVQICNQTWMTRNLDVTTYRNGDTIPEVTDITKLANLTTGAWCYYENDSANGKIYGKLYNWYAVNDPRGLAPYGWRVPSDEEWKELEICLGMTQAEADSMLSYRGTTQGSKLAGGYDLWADDRLRQQSDFNSSGFKGLPGGSVNDDGSFYAKGYFARWLTTTEFDSKTAICRLLTSNHTAIFRGKQYKTKFFSVRCLKD